MNWSKRSSMSRRWVVNASPLILLGKVRQVVLLRDLADELIVPGAVAQSGRWRTWRNENASEPGWRQLPGACAIAHGRLLAAVSWLRSLA
jgi:hypothetical protein